jgi:hypothetical protein
LGEYLGFSKDSGTTLFSLGMLSFIKLNDTVVGLFMSCSGVGLFCIRAGDLCPGNCPHAVAIFSLEGLDA